jgi:uncharacterized protein (UPF0147 family)
MAEYATSLLETVVSYLGQTSSEIAVQHSREVTDLCVYVSSNPPNFFFWGGQRLTDSHNTSVVDEILKWAEDARNEGSIMQTWNAARNRQEANRLKEKLDQSRKRFQVRGFSSTCAHALDEVNNDRRSPFT